MSQVVTEENAGKWNKSILSTLVGALAGAGGIAAMLHLAGTDLLDAMGVSRVALAAVGLVYGLMAAFIGFGLAVPRAGAKLLNVADAEELREERLNLLLSTLFTGALGFVLVLLALARGPGFAAGPVSAGAAMAALLLLVVVGVAMTWRWQNRYDELSRQLGLEGAAWAFCLSWFVLTLWGAADFLGFGGRLTAVDVVATLAAMLLFGSFVAIGRRGMMVR